MYANNIPYSFFPGDPLITWTFGSTIIVNNNGVQYYFRSDTYHTLGVNGNGFDSDYTNTAQSINETYAGSTDSVNYAFQVYLFSSPVIYTELTSGPSATMNVLGNFTGAANLTFNMPTTAVSLGYQALQISVLEQYGGGAWVTVANFISPVLITNSIEASTWQFILEINQTQLTSTNTTTTAFTFGDSTYRSGVNNILFSTPLQSDIAMWRFSRGDYIGWFLGEYLDEIGIGFYGLCLFLAGSTLYFRYKSLILFFFSIYGGAGGLAWVFLPPWASTVASAIIIIGGSFLIWRVIR